MNDLDERLIDCFQAALPKMPREKLRQVSMKSAAEWDSMVTITLMNLIEESFGIQADLDDIQQLTSFQSIRDYLLRKTAACKPN
jgi:acyl carrier protein